MYIEAHAKGATSILAGTCADIHHYASEANRPVVDCKRSESLFKWSLTLKNSSKANSPFHVLPDVVEGETQPFPDIDITFIHHCSITKM